MKHIVNFSGGLCSFWAAHRTVERFGRENTVLLFADVLIESKDLYAFNQRASELLGLPIVRVSREITPWELFRKQGLIGNSLHPICSIRLKRELLNAWMEGNFEMNCQQENIFFERGACVIGFDWTESHRVREMREAHPNWIVEAPMNEGERTWDKCRMESEARKIGLPISNAYEQGFPHDNCGRRCVRAGISHWMMLFRVDRPAYMEWANEERDTRADFKRRGIDDSFTMLKDRRGGETKPLSLLDLAERIESNDATLPKDEWGGCGCGGAK